MRSWRLLFVVGLVGVVAAGCSGDSPFEENAKNQSTTTVVAGGGDVTGGTIADNPYIPEDQNLSDCIGAVERPDCGSKAKGGWRQYLVMLAILGGVGVVGWRIAKSIKARDSVTNDIAERDAADKALLESRRAGGSDDSGAPDGSGQ